MFITSILVMIGFLLIGGVVLSYGVGLIATSPLAGIIGIAIGAGAFIVGLISIKSVFGD